MIWQQIYDEFIAGMQQTTWLEYVAVAFGIASVLYSRKENTLVYPTGIVNTVLLAAAPAVFQQPAPVC